MGTDSPVAFDGFISYSHAADDLLAPRLQAGLQKFAKPWWKRRAVRIFRDESSLAANPHLWSSITEALDDSSWFVLLLSEDAASSEWVGKEIEHWIANRPADRILPVVTDGEFTWENGDVAGSAVPTALHGVFTEEPRWVDLRFARGETDLDLQNPDFSAAVADIAATIRGVPKDELASEEVKQHRRTVRTAWAAGTTVTILAIAALVAGVFAIGQRNDARDSQQVAEQEATRANEEANRANSEADRANQEADRANTSAAEATRNAQLAQARELAASSVAMLDLDPELATLLAVAAIDASPAEANLPLQTENALWRAGATNRLVNVFEFDHVGHLSLAPDGGTLVATTGAQELTAFDTNSGKRTWAYSEETVDFFAQPAWGPDGRIALAVIDSTSGSVPAGLTGEDDKPNRLVILNAETGAMLATIPFPECPGTEVPAWSATGEHLAISNGSDACPRQTGSGESDHWIEVFDTATWESMAVLPVDGQGSGPVPRYDATGTLHALAPWSPVAVFEPGTYEPRPPTDANGIGDVSNDGTRYYLNSSASAEGGTQFGVWVIDAATGRSVDVLYNGSTSVSVPLGLEVTPDDRLVVVGTTGAFTHIYEASTSRELFKLPTGDLFSSAFDPATETLYTSGASGGVRVWDLRESAVGVEITGDLGPYPWVNGTGFSLGEELGAMETIDLGTFTWAVQFFELSSGALVGEPLLGTAGPRALTGGRFRIVEFESGREFLFDPITGERSELTLCQEEGFDEEGGFVCLGGDDPETYELFGSEDARELHAFGGARAISGFEFTGHYRRLDPATGRVLESIDPGQPADRFPEAINPLTIRILTDEWVFARGTAGQGIYDRNDGKLLYVEPFHTDRVEWSQPRGLVAVAGSTQLILVDSSNWEVVVSVSFPTRIRGASFNADGSQLAVGTLDALFVVDTDTGVIVRQLQLPGISDAHWIDNETLLVGTIRGIFGTVSLSTDAFLSDMRSNIRRSFSEAECDLYDIVPCPTLNELRNN